MAKVASQATNAMAAVRAIPNNSNTHTSFGAWSPVHARLFCSVCVHGIMEHFLVDVSRESCELVDVVCELWRVMSPRAKVGQVCQILSYAVRFIQELPQYQSRAVTLYVLDTHKTWSRTRADWPP